MLCDFFLVLSFFILPLICVYTRTIYLTARRHAKRFFFSLFLHSTIQGTVRGTYFVQVYCVRCIIYAYMFRWLCIIIFFFYFIGIPNIVICFVIFFSIFVTLNHNISYLYHLTLIYVLSFFFFFVTIDKYL